MEDKSRILIVDDDPDIRRVLTLLLRDDYEVSPAEDGKTALASLQAQPETDLVVLDVMMPGMDGFETCRRIREFSKVPILFLTAKSAEQDLLRAYAGGGDDFLSKPFSPAELLAKVRSLLRRWPDYLRWILDETGDVPPPGGESRNAFARRVRRGGKEIALTDTEYAILEHLLARRGKTVTAQEMYEAVWQERFLPGSANTVMVHVLNLRRKVEEDPSNPRLIRTVWGKGYQID